MMIGVKAMACSLPMSDSAKIKRVGQIEGGQNNA